MEKTLKLVLRMAQGWEALQTDLSEREAINGLREGEDRNPDLTVAGEAQGGWWATSETLSICPQSSEIAAKLKARHLSNGVGEDVFE